MKVSKNKILKNKSGFTLVEIMFTILLMGLLIAIASPRLSDVQARKYLEITTKNFETLVETVYNASTTGQIYPNQISSSIAPAYGVFIDLDSDPHTITHYIKDEDYMLSNAIDTEDTNNLFFDTMNDIVIEEYELEYNGVIQDIRKPDGTTLADCIIGSAASNFRIESTLPGNNNCEKTIDIIFLPPSGDMLFFVDGVISSERYLEIDIKNSTAPSISELSLHINRATNKIIIE